MPDDTATPVRPATSADTLELVNDAPGRYTLRINGQPVPTQFTDEAREDVQACADVTEAVAACWRNAIARVHRIDFPVQRIVQVLTTATPAPGTPDFAKIADDLTAQWRADPKLCAAAKDISDSIIPVVPAGNATTLHGHKGAVSFETGVLMSDGNGGVKELPSRRTCEMETPCMHPDAIRSFTGKIVIDNSAAVGVIIDGHARRLARMLWSAATNTQHRYGMREFLTEVYLFDHFKAAKVEYLDVTIRGGKERLMPPAKAHRLAMRYEANMHHHRPGSRRWKAWRRVLARVLPTVDAIVDLKVGEQCIRYTFALGLRPIKEAK